MAHILQAEIECGIRKLAIAIRVAAIKWHSFEITTMSAYYITECARPDGLAAKSGVSG